jgi:hypothetical protein
VKLIQKYKSLMEEQVKEVPLDQLPPQSLVNLKKQVEDVPFSLLV